MTAPNGPILFNSSTGSDTAASGLGPASAVSGSGASTTGASAVVTGVVTTGVSAGDLLWVQSSSGRQFSIVASVDSGTQVTCDDVFDNTESSRTWAIGGKRATGVQNVDSRRLFETDTSAGMIFEFASSHVETSVPFVNTTVAGTTSLPITMRAESGYTTRPKFSGSTGSGAVWFDINNDYWHLDGLEFATDVGATSIAYVCATRAKGSARDCVFDADGRHPHCLYCPRTALMNCTFKGATSTALSNFGSAQVRIDACVFQDCADGFSLTLGAGYVITRCIFKDMTGRAIYRVGSNDEFRNYTIRDCIFEGCGTGFSHTGTLVNSIYPSTVSGCIFSGNTTAVEFSTMTEEVKKVYLWENNAFFSNTTDTAGATHLDKISLSSDPFADAANSDFSLNSVAGGGAVLRASTQTVASTTFYPFNWLSSQEIAKPNFHPLS